MKILHSLDKEENKKKPEEQAGLDDKSKKVKKPEEQRLEDKTSKKVKKPEEQAGLNDVNISGSMSLAMMIEIKVLAV